MKASSEQAPKQLAPLLRWALLGVGCVAIILAVIGIFLPVLPTVPFLLLALACFARSSESFYAWLRDHDHLGPLIRPYLQGQGISCATKLKAISLVWISIGFSVLFLLDVFWVKGVLLAIATAVTFYLVRLPEAEER